MEVESLNVVMYGFLDRTSSDSVTRDTLPYLYSTQSYAYQHSEPVYFYSLVPAIKAQILVRTLSNSSMSKVSRSVCLATSLLFLN